MSRDRQASHTESGERRLHNTGGNGVFTVAVYDATTIASGFGWSRQWLARMCNLSSLQPAMHLPVSAIVLVDSGWAEDTAYVKSFGSSDREKRFMSCSWA